MPNEIKELTIEWPKGVPQTCTQGMLITAVRMWAKFASDLQIAQFLNIPAAAVRTYTSSLWWADLVKQLRPQIDFDIEQSFGRIGFKALSQLEDRLTYGDFYINREGQRARRPINAKDLAQIAVLAVTKREEARRLVEGTTDASSEGRSDLAVLADMLRAAASRQQKALQDARNNPMIDVTPVEEAVGDPAVTHAPTLSAPPSTPSPYHSTPSLAASARTGNLYQLPPRRTVPA